MIVDTDTANIAPRGIRTGSADANSVTGIQKASPASGAAHPRTRSPREIGIPARREKKSRDDEREYARCHDPCDVELQVPRHPSPCPMYIGTLARSAQMGEQDLSTEVELSLEAPQRCSPGERHGGDCTEGSQNAHKAILHRSILRDPDYQDLKAWVGSTLDPPRGLRVLPLGTRKPT